MLVRSCPTLLTQADDRGWYPVHYVLVLHNLPILTYLLNQGALRNSSAASEDAKDTINYIKSKMKTASDAVYQAIKRQWLTLTVWNKE